MSLRLALALAALLLTVGAAAATPPPMTMPMPATPPSAAPAPPKETVIIGPTGKSLVITPQVLADLGRAEATMINHGASHTYEGVRLTELLRLVDAPTGARIHADADRDYLVVTGGDGFRAVFSLAETDSSVQHDAPYRIVVDGDQKPARSVYAVSRIEVKVLP